MSRGPSTRTLYEQMVHRPDLAIDLTETALLIAKEEYPDLSVNDYMEVLDSYGKEIKTRIFNLKEIERILEEINRFLFQELKFQGNKDDYYNPDNSYLNRVIDRKLGIPITLSLLYMDIGKRLGIPIKGIGLPGHFIVQYTNNGHDLFLDPFHQGNILTPEDCWNIVEKMYSNQIPYSPKYLKPVSNKEILIRILRNLKGIYMNRQNYSKTLEVIDRILLINPDLTEELHDRGIIRYSLGQYSLALQDFRIYLKSVPVSVDTTEIRNYVQNILSRQARLN